MHIVLVSPRLDHGGGQRFVAVMADHWVALGHKVSVVSLRNQDVFYKMDPGITVHKLDYTERPLLLKPFKAVKTYFRLRKKLRLLGPDVVLSHLSSTNIFTLLAAINLPYRIFVQDVMSPERKRGFIEKYMRKKLYPRATGVIALTAYAKDFIFRETKPPNIVVIPNPITDMKMENPPEKEKIILNVGRLVPEKGQKYLLEAIFRINDPEWKVVILGEGPMRQPLEKRIRELGLDGRVALPGSVNNVKEWLHRASIFAFPSVSEGLPIALMEAMAAGLPCVSFDCKTGPSELIDDGKNGFLVPVGHLELFAKQIEELINNKALREAFSLRAEQVGSLYTVENISEAIFKMIGDT